MSTAIVTGLGTRTKCAELLQREYGLARAYEDLGVADALDIAIDAIVASPEEAADQDHRLDYEPNGARYKAPLFKEHLVQRLVLTQCQLRYSRLARSGKPLSKQGLTMAFIGGLARE